MPFGAVGAPEADKTHFRLGRDQQARFLQLSLLSRTQCTHTHAAGRSPNGMRDVDDDDVGPKQTVQSHLHTVNVGERNELLVSDSAVVAVFSKDGKSK
ncbi:hypothetical protein M514_22497, partial [Trichuris suis]